uniref:Splicing regulatory glutamine/lysine-rich protein 1 n=1 Tax=Strongyloides papillosus TaxID=174720 RepID=A0A0N5B8P9_STREA
MLGAQALRTKQKVEQKERERKKKEKLKQQEIINDPYSRRSSIEMHNQLLDRLQDKEGNKYNGGGRRKSHSDDNTGIGLIINCDDRKKSLVIKTVPEYVSHNIGGSNVHVRRMSVNPSATGSGYNNTNISRSHSSTPVRGNAGSTGRIGRAYSIAAHDYKNEKNIKYSGVHSGSFDAGIEKCPYDVIKNNNNKGHEKSKDDGKSFNRKGSRASLMGKRILKFFGLSSLDNDKEQENDKNGKGNV